MEAEEALSIHVEDEAATSGGHSSSDGGGVTSEDVLPWDEMAGATIVVCELMLCEMHALLHDSPAEVRCIYCLVLECSVYCYWGPVPTLPPGIMYRRIRLKRVQVILHMPGRKD